MIFTYKPAGRLRNKYTALAWINKKKNKHAVFETTPFTVAGHVGTYVEVQQSHFEEAHRDKHIYLFGCGVYVHIDDCSDFRIIRKVE